MGLADVDAGAELSRRAATVTEELAAVAARLEQARYRLGETSQMLRSGRRAREELHQARLARLEGRLAAMAATEQAKGILIAQSGCDAEQAGRVLRAAARRAGVPVGELAAEMVRQASAR
jgi:AmiR/NasT family two-component response regulator